MKLIDSKTLLFNLPLKTNDFGIIYQPKLKDFLEFDYVKFKTIFSVRKELYFDEDNIDGYDKIKDFDIIIFANLLNDLISSVKLLYKTDDVSINCKHDDVENIGILIKQDGETYFINRNNFTEFANLILILLHEGNNIAEKEVKKELDEIELKIEKRKKEFERKKAKREAELRRENNKDEEPLTIFDLANYVIHNNNKYDYENVLELTIYQLMNTFTLYNQKDGYEVFIRYKTSGNFNIDQDIGHWFFNK